MKTKGKPKKTSILASWKSFALAVLSTKTKEQQYLDMKMAFMAGAISSFNIVTYLGTLDTKTAIARIKALEKEITAEIMPGGFNREDVIKELAKTIIEKHVDKETRIEDEILNNQNIEKGLEN